MASMIFQTLCACVEAGTYVRSQSFSSKSAVKYPLPRENKIRDNKDNQIPTPPHALPPPPPRRLNIDRCITMAMWYTDPVETLIWCL